MKNKIDKAKVMRLAHKLYRESHVKSFKNSLKQAWYICKKTVNCRVKQWRKGNLDRIYIRDADKKLGYIDTNTRIKYYSDENRKNEYTQHLIWLQRHPEIFVWLD